MIPTARFGLCVTALLAVLTPAAAQEVFPSRPIKFIVPLAAGGGIDFTARVTAQKLSGRRNTETGRVFGAELSKLANQQSSKPPTPMENNAERIRASVARLSSSSIDELQGLVSELQAMQEFLKSEVNSVQRQINNALAGINIIIETIGPWKSIANSQTPSYGNRSFRGGAVANIESNVAASGSDGPSSSPHRRFDTTPDRSGALKTLR